MRFLNIGALSWVFILIPSVTALDFLAPGHSVAELLVVPSNLTLMTPRKEKAGFENQMFDFGSAQAGFSDLKRVLERQQTCPSGYGLCPNDVGICCPTGGRCCGGGKCCPSGRFCYSSGCCLNTQNGCDGSGCCDQSEQCCQGGDCCPSGNTCVTINGQRGCCPAGQTCTTGPTCTRTGYVPCEGESFCCPAGNVCYRDAANNPMCRDPTSTQPSASTTSVAPEPTTTSVAPEPTTTSVAPEPTTTVAPEPTTTRAPSPEPSTVVVHTTQTQVVTQTHQASNPVSPSTHGGSTTSRVATTSVPVVGTAAATTSNSTTNVGAIAGGTVAGVVIIAALVLILIFWRRKKASEAAATGPQHPFAHGQPTDPGYIPGQPAGPGYIPGQPAGPGYVPGQPTGPVYNPGAIPPTPGTTNPFLTPMGQHQNLGVSYFPGATPASPGPSGTGSGPDSQYTGLPEPQQSENAGATGGVLTMPVPLRDGNQPRPLPMTITSMQGGASDTDSARPWSGYMSGPPSSGFHASGWSGLPEVESDNSQPRWSVPAAPNMAQANAGAAYAANVPDRAPSTVYQPSSHAGGYDDIYAPQSPPPPSAYGGMAPAEGSGLPSGAAPPATNFAPGEKHVYRPY